VTPRRPKVRNCGTCGTLGSLVVALQDMYRRFPEWWDHEAWEAQHALWSLAYVEGLLPEDEIQAALDFVRVPVGTRRVPRD
jgi:hypothetical protein